MCIHAFSDLFVTMHVLKFLVIELSVNSLVQLLIHIFSCSCKGQRPHKVSFCSEFENDNEYLFELFMHYCTAALAKPSRS